MREGLPARNEGCLTSSPLVSGPAERPPVNFVKVVQRVPVKVSWVGHPSVPLRAGLSAEVTAYVE